MRHFIDLLGRFRRDESGAFAIIFAMIAIVLVAMSGAVVDFTSVQQARTKAQVALDSAALALQPTIYNSGVTGDTIKPQAEALLVNRLADAADKWGDCKTALPAPYNVPVSSMPCVTMTTPLIDQTAGTLTLTATLTIPMNFVDLVGVKTMQVQIQSVATRQKLNLEVAMVLDNSGSMGYTMGYNGYYGGTTRMQTLHDAATCAVKILFYSNYTDCSASTTGLTPAVDTTIGIVPFSQEVNVGYSLPNADLDRAGTTAGSVTVDNFDYTGSTAGDQGLSGVDRVALFSKMKDSSGNTMSWAGCVQARANPYDTTDDPPSSSTPATLYTPFFAVDEPDSANANGGTFYNNYINDSQPTNNATACIAPGKCTVVTTKTSSGWSTTTSVTATLVTSAGTTSGGNACSCSGLSVTTTTKTSGSTTTTTQVCSPNYQPTNLTSQQFQARLCKYNGAKMTAAVSGGNVFGPNGDCPAARVQPLDDDPSTIISAINAMQPLGGTNITQGAAWGFRLLSPNAPFDALPYDSATSKVLIIMTDGENTIYPGSNMNDDQYNSAYGFPLNINGTTPTGRLLPASAGTSQLRSASALKAEMDKRLSTICTNAKNNNIAVYTIAVDVKDTTDPTGNATLLSNCATSPDDYFQADDSATLLGDFQKIANQLAALRLAK
jgi:Flp pilus assembly protein TadG